MARSYESPEIMVISSVEELTLAGGSSGSLDGNYPPGTPGPDGLFS